MTFKVNLLVTAVLLCAASGTACAAADQAITDPAQAGADFAIQGEYLGELKIDGKETRTGVQVIALGAGAFDAVSYAGGLPGDGWKRGDKSEKASGKTAEKATRFTGPGWTAEIKDGTFVVSNSAGEQLGAVKRVERRSPTLDLKSPVREFVLFEGTGLTHLRDAKMTEDHLLMAGTATKESFRDFVMHIEFRVPFMPTARGQGRGNSGVYLQNRYEVQVLDSFGLEGANNECGAIYSFKAPSVNMCFPPLTWQTYDVDFTAARFEDDKKVKSARVTVKHNGVTVIDDYEIPDKTPGGADTEAPGRGPILLQFHGNPVVYRNMWALEKKP